MPFDGRSWQKNQRITNYLLLLKKYEIRRGNGEKTFLERCINNEDALLNHFTLYGVAAFMGFLEVSMGLALGRLPY
jgi:hypothetical protein